MLLDLLLIHLRRKVYHYQLFDILEAANKATFVLLLEKFRTLCEKTYSTSTEWSTTRIFSVINKWEIQARNEYTKGWKESQ